MASAIEQSLVRTRALSRTTWDRAIAIKQAGGGLPLTPQGGLTQLSQYRDQAANRRRYGLFRGWVHSAINALGEEAACQPVTLKRMKRKGKPGKTKAAESAETEVKDHPLLHRLDLKPNPIQYRFQFVYSFIANMSLTGWGFIVADEEVDDETGVPYFYSLPTTWVKPIHDKGPFAEFKVVNPNDPASEADQKPIPGSRVAFAHFPDPTNPLSAMPPAAAQNIAVEVDDKIQTSQRGFFDNGIFPSVIVTVGKHPHPDVPAGLRPRLSAVQRRQVYAAIRKVSGGVANYGNPAIVDGLIEKIERLSATSNEMGWDKSEKAVRTRILSAFGVHPFILGEHVGVGGYAQVFNIEKRFGKKVNVFLSLLSTIMSEFAPPLIGEHGLKICYGPFEADDPSLRQQLWLAARGNGDVNQNEFRSYMGLPPDKDLNQNYISQTLAQQALAVASGVTAGGINKEQGVALLEGMGVPTSLAVRIAGEGASEASAIEQLEEVVKALNEPVRLLIEE